MLKRLRIKFVCIDMGIVVAMLAAIFALVLGFTRQDLARENDALMRSALSLEQRDPPRGEPDPAREQPPAERSSPAQARDARLFRAYILVELDAEGRIGRVEGYDAEDRDSLEAMVAAALAAGRDSGALSAYSVRYLLDRGPMGTRLVFTDRSSETATMRALLRTCAIIGAASLVAFFAVSVLLARWAVKPVERAWEQQRQFVSDASHELKTPLTVIMTNAELLQSPEYGDAARARFGANILTMARQMRSLVESLLELARVENGAVTAAAAAEVDLSALCADALLPFEPLCFEQGLGLSSELEPGVRVRGSESHLRQVVEILLDNAQKYADPGGEVTVRLVRTGAHCLLSVADTGAPIAPEDLPRLFERFYRADKARGRDGSYGLGLSIARKITEEHHGKIWAESAEGVNTFSVSLPALPRTPSGA